MPEYGHHEFEHVDDITKSKNPREQLDKMYKSDEEKLRVVQKAIRVLRLELNNLENKPDPTMYSSEDITQMENLRGDIETFELMEKELEANIDGYETIHTDSEMN